MESCGWRPGASPRQVSQGWGQAWPEPISQSFLWMGEGDLAAARVPKQKRHAFPGRWPAEDFLEESGPGIQPMDYGEREPTPVYGERAGGPGPVLSVGAETSGAHQCLSLVLIKNVPRLAGNVLALFLLPFGSD